MKQTNVFSSILMHFKQSFVGDCLTIFRPVMALVLTASYLTACSPGGTTNNYGGSQAGMSGGGATKDPGDGTGGATGDGGGGQGVQCGDSKNPKLRNRIVVRDVYEAISNHGLTMKSIDSTEAQDRVSNAALITLTSALKGYFGPASDTFEFTNEAFWLSFVSKISFLEDDKVLYPSKDANSPIALPEQCKIVQIAYWDESPGASEEGTLYVSKKYWNNLDQINKIALLAHEVFFKQARHAGYKNSDFIRIKIGKLLSEEGLEPLFTGWSPSEDKRLNGMLPKSPKGFKICEGISEKDPEARLTLFQYEGTDKKQHLVFPRILANGLTTSIFQSSHFTFDPLKNENLARITDQYFFRLSEDFAKEKRPKNWENLRISEASLLYFEANAPTEFSEIVSYYRKQIKSSKPFSWGDYVSNGTKKIKISLSNPVSNYNAYASANLKSREELMSLLYKNVRAEFGQCLHNSEMPSENKIQKVEEAISILKNEIEHAIASSIYPSAFPKWNAAVIQIDNKLVLKYPPMMSGKPALCGFSKIDKITKELPQLLYSLILSTYTYEQVKSTLGDDGFTEESEVIDPRDNTASSEVYLESDSSSVGFSLTCKNYGDIYNSQSLKSANTLYSDYLPNLYMNFSFSNALINTRDYSQEPLNLIKSFSEYLSGDVAGVAKLNQTKDLKELQHDLCDDVDWRDSNTCRDTKAFINDLNSGKNIDIHECSEYNTFAAKFESTRKSKEQEVDGCIILNIRNIQRSYIVYFSYMDPTIYVKKERYESQPADFPNFNLYGRTPVIRGIRLIPFKVNP